MKSFFILFISLISACSCGRACRQTVIVSDLRCNYIDSPSGITGTPQFSWIIESSERGKFQSAYQIVLADDPESTDHESGHIWNSGMIPSSNTTGIRYEGPQLESGKHYFWKVKVWDQSGGESEWSDPAVFITGLNSENDWDGARWIGYEELPDSLILVPGIHGSGNNLGPVAMKRPVTPCFRKEFTTVKKLKKAIVFISGLGHYELSINGKRTGDHYLSPGWTDYRKSCLYNTYDVTKAIKKGNNAVGIIAGNGFFNINRERYRKLVIAYGAPKVIMKLSLQYDDGEVKTIITDDTWKTAPSPVTYTSIYGGEDYDARLEQEGWNVPGFDDSEWNKALTVKPPEGKLRPESDHPVRVMESFKPVRIINPGGKVFVYDFGQNASGIVKLTVAGRRGTEVRIVPGELLSDDSLVTQRATGDPFYFQYTLRGSKKESWTPRFTYYGFRYAEIRGAVPENYPNPEGLPVIKGLELLHTRNSSPVIGSFSCSSELFNSIYKLIDWSIKSNLASVATDCPHREKLGWLEQTHLMGNSIRYIYDIRNLYNKVIDDMIEAQADDGLVPDIAPEYVHFLGGFRDSPEWGSACIILPWNMYEWYGDKESVIKAYPMMKRYLGYLESKAENNILSHGLGDWFDLGPKRPGEAQLTPKALTATAIWYYDTRLMAKMAELTGNTEDASTFSARAEEIRKSFNIKFFDEKSRSYATGSQTSFAMPLYFGMVDEEFREDVTKNLVRSITDNNKALTAGDIGYRYLLRALEESGNSQLIFDMNSRSDVPGYGYQLSLGATALTESWAGLRNVSNNHMMLGHLMEWFFSAPGGIRQYTAVDGSADIIISPEPAGDLRWAETSYNSAFGRISCNWKITGGSFILETEIPSNCRAKIFLPAAGSDIMEGEKAVESAEGIMSVSPVNGKTRIEVNPGHYTFRLPYSR